MPEPFDAPVTNAVSVLFSPDAAFVVDIFRALGDFEEHYDVVALDRLEEGLSRRVDRGSAKALVSDALLLAFGMRRERMAGLDLGAPGSRRATRDEYSLYTMIAASYWRDDILADEAAHALDLRHARPLLSLACEVARRLEAAGLRLEMPNVALLAQGETSIDLANTRRERVEIYRYRSGPYALDV